MWQMTMQQKHIAAAVAAVLVLIIIAVMAYRHSAWMKKNCVCITKSGFHGWRDQHYVDNPYNGQNYQCGKGGADGGY